jgi:tRNA pseudouridine55 synthase
VKNFYRKDIMDGILIIDKPQGITSHDVVDLLRRHFGFKKVGHAGTLDPMATGVLVMLIGAMTKSSHNFISDDKEYEGEMILGVTSDTGDMWGKLVRSEKDIDFTPSEIEKAFGGFTGDIEQAVPMYSAVKYNGKKLYELARKGLSVDVKPRKISVRKLEILDIKLPAIYFRVVCSKGTYIRQLAVDIGKALGSGACLSALRRTRSGRFNISEALDIEAVKKMTKDDIAKRFRAL